VDKPLPINITESHSRENCNKFEDRLPRKFQTLVFMNDSFAGSWQNNLLLDD